MYRAFYEARSTLISMWRGNPVLTALVFGLPLGFLSLICYSICCADILDEQEEEQEGKFEKNFKKIGFIFGLPFWFKIPFIC